MKIEFIISCYQRPACLTSILGSLQAQTSDRWIARVFRDGPFDGYEKVKNMFIDDPRITFTELNGPHNDWGNTPRNIALKNLSEEWVVMSGHDNYYLPIFVERFLSHASNDVNFVYCDMMHNLNNYTSYLLAEPKLNKIDIGNFMVRSKYAAQMQLNSNYTGADGQFVEEYLSKFGGDRRHINQALYVHN